MKKASLFIRAQARIKQIINDHFFSLKKRLVIFMEIAPSNQIQTNLIHFRVSDFETLQRLKSAEWDVHEADLPALKERLQMNDLFFLGEDKIYGWITLKRFELTSKKFLSLPPYSAFSYRVFCHPNSRNKGYARAYYDYVKNYLYHEGVSNLYSTVEAMNIPSVQAHLKSGFKIVGSYYHIRLLKFEFAIWTKRPDFNQRHFKNAVLDQAGQFLYN